MSEVLPILFTGLIFLLIGTVCLFFPKRIQEYSIKSREHAKGLAKFNPFIGWMKTQNYLLSLRIIGVLAFLASGLAFYVMIFQKY
jgi:hypothetical protein